MVEGGEWDACAKLTNFTTYGQDTPAKDQTEVWVTCDGERLYLAFRCRQPEGTTPKATAEQRDGALWEDDSVELFIQPDTETGNYYQFLGNSKGVFRDGVGTDNKWNGDWVYRASVHDGYWEGEASISFASLGMEPPAEGKTIGLNICRDHQVPTGYASCWSPASGGFHNPSIFGRLAFSAQNPVTRQEAAAQAQAARPLGVHLNIDWRALGLDPNNTILRAPGIDFFQRAAEFSPQGEIPVDPGKGWLLVLEPK